MVKLWILSTKTPASRRIFTSAARGGQSIGGRRIERASNLQSAALSASVIALLVKKSHKTYCIRGLLSLIPLVTIICAQHLSVSTTRSEERRVGKECRA